MEHDHPAGQEKWNNNVPPFFSIAFHTSFFPALLKRRLVALWRTWFPPKDASPFSRHVMPETIIFPAISLAVMVGGFGSALKGSTTGGVIGALGAAGLVTLLVLSIRARRESDVAVTFEDFEPLSFLLFLLLGVNAGFLLGSSVIGIPAGLVAGYFTGIAVGRWLPCLGWMIISLRLLIAFGLLMLLVFDTVWVLIPYF